MGGRKPIEHRKGRGYTLYFSSRTPIGRLELGEFHVPEDVERSATSVPTLKKVGLRPRTAPSGMELTRNGMVRTLVWWVQLYECGYSSTDTSP